MEDVIGWILAWLPEGGENYNFEFFAERGAGGKIQYAYDPWGNGDWESEDAVRGLTALERANKELHFLTSNESKLRKFGMKVVHGYVKPVISRASYELGEA